MSAARTSAAPAPWEVRDAVAALRRRWRVAASGMVIGVLLALGYAVHTDPGYSATAVVALTPIDTDALSAAAERPVNTETEAQIVISSAVAERAARALHWQQPATELLTHVEVASPQDSQVLRITFTAPGARRAASGANAFATSYLDFRASTAQARVDELLGRLDQQITSQRPDDGNDASVTQPLQQLREQAARLESTVVDAGQLVSRAEPPDHADGLGTSRTLAAGLLLGLVVGLVAAACRDRRDPRIYGPRDVEDVVGLRVLGRVRADDPADDGYSSLAAKLAAHEGDGAPRLLLASTGRRPALEPLPGNLARAVADRGHDVALVHVRAGTGHPPGPTDLPSGWRGVRALFLDQADVAGPEQREVLGPLVPGTARVIDCVSGASRSAVLTLAPHSASVLLVAEVRSTRPRELEVLLEDLVDVGATVSGVLLVDPGRSRSAPTRGHSSSTRAPRRGRPDAAGAAAAPAALRSPVSTGVEQ